jgi:methyl-accepting chemotaxis protein
MAINTSLRCSRMGEAGKPINVVATELRAIAEQMEVVSGRLLMSLRTLEEKAVALTSPEEEGIVLGERLDRALASISDAGSKISNDLNQLAERGDGIARDVSRNVASLDFTRDIGTVLDECTWQIEEHAAALADPDAEIEEPSEALLRLADSLYAAYTMARERQVHGLVFAPPVASATREAMPAEDDLDAAFF